jgi:hypothetical protein
MDYKVKINEKKWFKLFKSDYKKWKKDKKYYEKPRFTLTLQEIDNLLLKIKSTESIINEELNVDFQLDNKFSREGFMSFLININTGNFYGYSFESFKSDCEYNKFCNYIDKYEGKFDFKKISNGFDHEIARSMAYIAEHLDMCMFYFNKIKTIKYYLLCSRDERSLLEQKYNKERETNNKVYNTIEKEIERMSKL